MTDLLSGWQRVLLKPFGFGAGFALLCAVVVGGLVWYSRRPKPPQAWNTQAITATYDYVTTKGEQNRIVFVYTLQNNTQEDYRIDSESEVDVFHKLVSQNSIYHTVNKRPEIAFPIFVPAGGRTTLVIGYESEYSGAKINGDDQKKYRADVQEFVKTKHPNLGGFVLFDQIHRYEIELPKGW